MPLPLVLAFLALMLSALAYGFAGPPASRQRPAITLLLLGLGLLAVPLGLAAVAIRHPAVGMGVVCAGVLCFACAAHQLRAPDSEGESDDDGGGGRPRPTRPDRGPGGLGVDWEAFDRARERWSPDRGPVGAR